MLEKERFFQTEYNCDIHVQGTFEQKMTVKDKYLGLAITLTCTSTSARVSCVKHHNGHWYVDTFS